MRRGGRVAAFCVLAAAIGTAARGALADDPADDDQDTQILAALAQPSSPDRPSRTRPVFCCSPPPICGARAASRMAASCGRRPASTGRARCSSSCSAAASITISPARSAMPTSAGELLAGAILPGWRFVRDGFTVTVFLGYDFQQHRLTPDDLSAGLRGNYAGARTGFELWYQPTADDDGRRRRLVVHRRAELQRAARRGPARVRCVLFRPGGAGLRRRRQLPAVPRRPSRHRLADRRFEWSAGAGWATDTDDRSSAYGKLGVFTRR